MATYERIGNPGPVGRVGAAGPVDRVGAAAACELGADGASRTSDTTLVERAAAGRVEAFDELYRRHEPTVRSVIRAETRREDDVADLVQDTFTLAWRRIGSLRDPERFRPWLLQIARRSVIDQARRTARRPLLGGNDHPTLERIECREAGPDEVHELHELTRRLDRALAGLSRRDATVITLAAQFGFGPHEIAAAIGTSPSTAKVVLHRARVRLRAALAA